MNRAGLARKIHACVHGGITFEKGIARAVDDPTVSCIASFETMQSDPSNVRRVIVYAGGRRFGEFDADEAPEIANAVAIAIEDAAYRPRGPR